MRTAAPNVIALAAVLVAGPLSVGALAGGCAPRIGDGCQTSTNCSINGDRLCDTSQPGGNCLVFDCQPDSCPDDAVCVRFNPVPARRSIVACMRRCNGDGDCRAAEGYRCIGEADVDPVNEGDPDPDVTLDVDVLDAERPDGRFCVADQ